MLINYKKILVNRLLLPNQPKVGSGLRKLKS